MPTGVEEAPAAIAAVIEAAAQAGAALSPFSGPVDPNGAIEAAEAARAASDLTLSPEMLEGAPNMCLVEAQPTGDARLHLSSNAALTGDRPPPGSFYGAPLSASYKQTPVPGGTYIVFEGGEIIDVPRTKPSDPADAAPHPWDKSLPASGEIAAHAPGPPGEQISPASPQIASASLAAPLITPGDGPPSLPSSILEDSEAYARLTHVLRVLDSEIYIQPHDPSYSRRSLDEGMLHGFSLAPQLSDPYARPSASLKGVLPWPRALAKLGLSEQQIKALQEQLEQREQFHVGSYRIGALLGMLASGALTIVPEALPMRAGAAAAGRAAAVRAAGPRITRWTVGRQSVSLDTNVLVPALQEGQELRLVRQLNGRRPIVSPQAASEYLFGPPSQRTPAYRAARQQRLTEFLRVRGGRLGAAAPEILVEEFQITAGFFGKRGPQRVLHEGDARVVVSAWLEGTPLMVRGDSQLSGLLLERPIVPWEPF